MGGVLAMIAYLYEVEKAGVRMVCAGKTCGCCRNARRAPC